MSEGGKAVFLSYASQDAEAARRICEALRAAGVEVWFDQSELVGGDAWDQKIRRQIKECALFIPVISANTQARPEGYFRLEWLLAVERSRLMSDDHPFLFPVVIDDTPDAAARVPDRFRDVQWTRLNVKDTPESLAARVAKILGGGGGLVDGAAPGQRPVHEKSSPSRLHYAWLICGLAIGGFFAMWPLLKSAGAREKSSPPPAPAPQPLSEARKLAGQARALLLIPGGSTKFETAALLCDRALALDPADAELWAVASQVDARMWYHDFDRSTQRKENARSKAARALNLDPTSFEARLAQATYLVFDAKEPMADQAEPVLQSLRSENPREYRVLEGLAELFQMQGKDEAALACLNECAQLPEASARALMKAGWVLQRLRRIPEMEAALDRSIALQPFVGAVALRVFYDLGWHGDIDHALATLRKLPAEELAEDHGIAAAVRVYRWRREPEELLKFLGNVPRDWITWSVRAPKAALTGDANAELGRLGAARADWQSALALVEQRLAATPNDRSLLEWKAYLVSELGEPARAHEIYARALEAPPYELALFSFEKIQRLMSPDEIIDELERRVRVAEAALNRRRQVLDQFVSAADLRLNPAWDGVRPLPRFQALQARLDADSRFNPKPTETTALKPDDKSLAVLAVNDLGS